MSLESQGSTSLVELEVSKSFIITKKTNLDVSTKEGSESQWTPVRINCVGIDRAF